MLRGSRANVTVTVSLLSLVAGLVVLWAFALTGLANPLGLPWGGGSRSARTNPGGMRVIVPAAAQDTEGGVSIGILEASFSSSETRLLMEVAGLPPALTLPDFSRGTTLRVSGVAGASDGRLSETAAPSSGGNPRFALPLGPVLNVDEPLVVSLHYDGSAVGSLPASVAWQISFVPGPGARDPVDESVALDHSVDYGKASVRVKGVHISSSQISLFYDLTVQPGFAVEAVEGAVASVIYDDGQKVAGGPGAQLIERLPDGSVVPKFAPPTAIAAYAVTFPLVRSSTDPFTVQFGRLMVTGSDARSYSIPVDGSPLSVHRASDDFQIRESGDDAGNVTIQVKRVSDGSPGSFLIASPKSVTLVDDLGNAYPVTRGEVGFRKTSAGEAVPDRTVMVFAGPLASGVRVLHLVTSDSAVVVEPSAGASIRIH